MSWSIDKSLSDLLRVYGSDGEARVGWRESAWRTYGGEWQVIGSGYEKLASMGGALLQFCEAVRTGGAPAAGPEEAMAAVAAIDAAYLSFREQRWVKIAEVAC